MKNYNFSTKIFHRNFRQIKLSEKVHSLFFPMNFKLSIIPARCKKLFEIFEFFLLANNHWLLNLMWVKQTRTYRKHTKIFIILACNALSYLTILKPLARTVCSDSYVSMFMQRFFVFWYLLVPNHLWLQQPALYLSPCPLITNILILDYSWTLPQ